MADVQRAAHGRRRGVDRVDLRPLLACGRSGRCPAPAIPPPTSPRCRRWSASPGAAEADCGRGCSMNRHPRRAARVHSPPVTPAEVEAELLRRWPESQLDPSLDRIRDLLDVLGDPQTAYPVILRGRHERQDVDRADDRGAAPGRRAAHRAVHQPAPGTGAPSGSSWTARRSTTRRSSAAYEDLRPYLDIVDARHEHPAVVLRGADRDGVRDLRRRPGRRRRRRGRHGRDLGRHQPGRRAGRRGHADRAGPPGVPGRHPRRHRGGEGRDHQARLARHRWRSSRWRRRRCWCGGARRSAPRSLGRAWSSASRPAAWPWAASC